MRRPRGDEDFVTKHQVVVILRARIRGLWRYYRRKQREEGRVRTTGTSWCRAEIRKAHRALAGL